jgi:putative intracellular protease/amidase
MKLKAYILVFNGLTDWEAAHALCEIKRSDKFDVVTIGFSDEPVITMGGFRVLPDTTLDAVVADEAAILILPGGDMWEEKPNEKIIALLHKLKAASVPIAAICGATLEIARAKLTQNLRHTSNSLDYLATMVADYQDKDFYVNELAVTDNSVITASGLGSVEFGQEIIKQLDIYDEADTKVWFEMFKHGIIPK